MEQELEKQVIRMSVRNLVEFIFRSGDIDSRRRKAEQEAMALRLPYPPYIFPVPRKR